MASEAETTVPLSDAAQEKKELMHQQLMRKMASKMMSDAIEEERKRRIEQDQPGHEDKTRNQAYNRLIVVQEDLVRTMNLLKVKADAELEQAQRVTEDKKKVVHEELIRKAAANQADKDSELERERRIAESKDESTEENVERRKTYNKLVTVQEDMLKTLQRMRVDQEMKLEQERRILEGKKDVIHEQLMHEVSKREADRATELERQRRIGENLSEEEIQRRVGIAHKMLDVQKELLSTHQPVKAISGQVSHQVLEEAKAHFQEQILRKANQKEAISAMEDEQKRRVAEAPLSPIGGVTDSQVTVLEEINRKASVKKAKQMADETQQEYVLAEQKSRAQEDTVRKIHQKQADQAMAQEQHERIEEMSGKDPPTISPELKKALMSPK